MKASGEDQPQTAETASKRAYSKPVLRSLGLLRRLTRFSF
jgi:hypothetical protein